MENDVFWNAIQAKDARFNGAFVFGVKTTGIYCKPSCAAKRPKRENVAFFDRGEAAESEGFRACLRCKPSSINAVDPLVKAVLKACKMIDSDNMVSLNGLSSELNVSTFQLQRKFKELIGVSPKKYAEAKRMEKFRSGIREGDDVTDAMYDAGFGSSSRLYENVSEKLGMTPAVYKKGGKGIKISYVITECELGRLLVARTPRGICSVTFGDDDAVLAADLENEFPNAEIAYDGSELKSSVEMILEYLAGKTKRLLLPLDLQATAFQLQVWEFLRKIPYGQTLSYSQVAEKLGDKKKVRAVAQACARNRVALVIPCHRVVASNGKLSGYRWGMERKKALLERESK